jgi:hypothetical protein
MSGHKNLFIEMEKIVGTISFGDASKVKVKGQRQCKIYSEE